MRQPRIPPYSPGPGSTLPATGRCTKTVLVSRLSATPARNTDEVCGIDKLPYPNSRTCLCVMWTMAVRPSKGVKWSFQIPETMSSMARTLLLQTPALDTPSPEPPLAPALLKLDLRLLRQLLKLDLRLPRQLLSLLCRLLRLRPLHPTLRLPDPPRLSPPKLPGLPPLLLDRQP